VLPLVLRNRGRQRDRQGFLVDPITAQRADFTLALAARFRKADLGISAKREELLVPMDTILQTPKPGAGGAHQQNNPPLSAI